ncbi:MAG: S49 family peptidase, partial [Burkholderiales bacterium]
IIAAAIVYSFAGKKEALGKGGKQVAVVNLRGTISDENKTYNNLVEGLNDALKDKNTVAVIIRANSPGGSPVYSNMVYEEILRLKKLYPHKPIDVVVEEACASGCYYIAAAADKIYANPASIIGSIGVIYPGFGLTGLMQKIGLDSRLLVAGKNKAMGYPFTPVNKEQEAMQQQMLDKIHQQFISAVKNGRGKRLELTDPDLFSGRHWIGEDGIKLGLIDGFATVDSLARDQFKIDNIVDFTPEQDPLDKIAKKMGVNLVDGAYQAVKTAELASFN